MKKTTKFLTMALAMGLAACALTACGGSSAKDSGNTITFGTNPEFPPFEFVTSNGVLGEFDGIGMAIAMIVKEDSDIATAADMEDKRICVIQGYTGEVCVQEMGYTYEAFKKGTEAIMELVNGKCDVVVLDSATAQKYVSDNEGLKIVEDASAFESEEYAIAVQKDNTELLNKINASIEKMIADGTINELAVQYTEAAAE